MKPILFILVGTLFLFGAIGCSGSDTPAAGTDATSAAPANEAPVEYMDPKGTDNTTQGATQTDM